MDALRELFSEARDRHWCVQPYCTTCGARDYRTAIHANAVALVEALRSARIRDLRREFPTLDVQDALHLLMMELATPLEPLFGKTPALDSELAGTEAGEYLDNMRRHARAVAEERAQRAAYESPEAVAERRRGKQELRGAQRRAREEQKGEREKQAAAALEALGRLEPEVMFKRVIANETGVYLYRLSAAQIDALVGVLTQVSEAELEQLRLVVPMTRVRPLAQLSKALNLEIARRRLLAGET